MSVWFAAFFAASAYAAPAPVLEWEVSGFDTPESALIAADLGVIYVSNVAGKPTDKNGNGFISTVGLDGKIKALKWVDGLNAPKGLARHGGTLYAADIDQLVAIDIATGKVTSRYDAPGAKFLNDVAAGPDGHIYVSDLVGNAIWRLEGDRFSLWIEDEALQSPNGLLVQGGDLVVGAFGVMTDGFVTKVPGHLLRVSIADKSIQSLGSGEPVGNLDGVEPFDDGTYLVTDFKGGALLKIDAAGGTTVLLDTVAGSADLGYDSSRRLAVIPFLNDGVVKAYRMP